VDTERTWVGAGVTVTEHGKPALAGLLPEAAGLILTPHAPEFFPLPFYAGVGPEGGGAFIAIWFIGLAAWGSHALWRMRSKRRALKNANTKPQLIPDATAQQETEV
jgi:hypothetical protein